MSRNPRKSDDAVIAKRRSASHATAARRNTPQRPSSRPSMPCDVAIPILDVRGRAKNLSIEGRSCDFLTGRDAILRAYPDRVTAILLSRGLGTNSPDAAPSYPEEV